MSRRAVFILVALGALAAAVWRSQLFSVSSQNTVPRPLALLAPPAREPARFDVALPMVPAGMRRLRQDDGPRVIHYWAPWTEGALDQAAGLDSLGRDPALSAVSFVIVTFEPFPSVARYVGRHRIQTPVLIDGHRELRRALPCPRMPFTYVIDDRGRIAAAVEGPVDWLAPATRDALLELVHKKRARPEAGPVS